MKKCINEYYCELDKPVEIQFQLNGFSVQFLTEFDGVDDSADYGYLKISVESTLREYESIIDSEIFSRSKYLVALGIASFVIDEPLDVFGSTSKSYVSEGNIESVEPRFILDGVDNTQYLIEIIEKLTAMKKHESDLFFSLLDRWRKARFMEKNSETSFIYTDEATLAYFHVLELLGDLYSKELKAKSDVMISTFVSAYNEEVLSLSGQSLEGENSSKTKLLSSLLSKDLSVTGKILYLLKKYDLYSNQTAFWIKNLVEARNSVAHGRRVFYDKSIFPVQPFFPLVTDTIYPLQFIRVLTANVISKHLGVHLYSNEWNVVETFLIEDVYKTKEYLSLGHFKPLDEIDDVEENIVNGGISLFVLSKKISANQCVDFYRFYLTNESENQDFLYSNIYSIIILFESVAESDLSDMLKQAILNTYTLECNVDFKFRDTMYSLEFHGFETPKLEALIKSGVIR
ncbi:hypothetical protein JYB87_03160 [Shewanella avicenniae]|uniref:Apea-like HEPN domain-containing protein n=1 Tax=Shewanella avicenniae TaxID=2814294 RepID=A0ABX7QSP4_9GAMM|nr:hypothetical protein [Shewanella avicenniae]QSX34264.1 hypothetical protein JYB87_03160 [Shewanella avicenniae]